MFQGVQGPKDRVLLPTKTHLRRTKLDHMTETSEEKHLENET